MLGVGLWLLFMCFLIFCVIGCMLGVIYWLALDWTRKLLVLLFVVIIFVLSLWVMCFVGLLVCDLFACLELV